MKHKLKISYDGSSFSGWQIQPNAPSIQEEIEKALLLLLKKKCRLIGSGRTDQGAHALGQIAHYEGEKVDLNALNGILPKAIRVLEIKKVDDDFHAQYSAKGKIYHYHLWLKPVSNPFLAPFRYKVPFKISLEKLAEGTRYFVGTHDFKTFANVGSSIKTTIRTIKRIDIVQQEGGVRLEFEGNGFLYKMVRNIVGTLLSYASGQEVDIEALLAAQDRRAAGMCAPSHALFLMQVHYEMNRCAQKEAPSPAERQSPLLATQK